MSKRGTVDRRALARAPLAMVPVALVFVVVRSLLASDLRELVVSPLTAAVIGLVGYPIAVAAIWLVGRWWPKALDGGLGVLLLTGLACAEAGFWVLIHPIWQRDFSNAFCAALVGACGMATAAAYRWLKSTRPHRP